jgi:hypothetical protein
MTKNGKLTMLDHIVAAMGSDSLKVAQIIERLGDKYTEGSIRQTLFNHKGHFENPSRGVYKVAANPVIKEKTSRKEVKAAPKKITVAVSSGSPLIALREEEKRIKEEMKVLQASLKKVEKAKAVFA